MLDRAQRIAQNVAEAEHDLENWFDYVTRKMDRVRPVSLMAPQPDEWLRLYRVREAYREGLTILHNVTYGLPR